MTALIEMHGIERTYVMGDNLVHALSGVDLTIETGSSIAIMGTSGSGARGGDAGGPAGPGGAGSDGAPRTRDFGDKKPIYKLVDGKPKMVLIKPGLTDGSSTQMVEGDLAAGDLLITEIIGAPTGPTRKIGAF